MTMDDVWDCCHRDLHEIWCSPDNQCCFDDGIRPHRHIIAATPEEAKAATAYLRNRNNNSQKEDDE